MSARRTTRRPAPETQERAADEIRRGVYGTIGGALVAGAGLLVALWLTPKRAATATPSANCAGCGARSAAKVYG